MDIIFKGKYKSITDFVWEDIPKFVVLTGPNGTGKSQLLELIYYSVLNSNKINEKIEFREKDFFPNELIFLKGEWNMININSIDYAKVHQRFNNYYTQFLTKSLDIAQDNQKRLYYTYETILELSGKSHPQDVSEEDFRKLLPEILIENEFYLSHEINEIFYKYKLSEINLKAKGKNDEEIRKEIGEKPWIVLREIIVQGKLPYEINDPENLGIFDTFRLTLTHSILNEEIPFSDLSSGERVLLSLVFYLFSSQEKNVFPKLLLMDEPDAHLHPSMSQQFLDVVKKVLVDKYGIQVIMTTHSPSTVILAPEESIYEMSITEPRIRKGTSKNHCVSLLTGGLVFVGEGTKYVLVEDKTDVDFYTYVYRKLIEDNQIDSDIPIVFIAASTKTESGGKNAVKNWVEKLRDSGLVGVLHGLIDEDSGNEVSQGIYKIDRYCLENYLADPIFVFAVLIDVESDRLPQIEGLKFSVGEEHKLKNISQEDLQKIVDAILEKVETQLKITFSDFDEVKEKTIVEITYTNGVKLNFPQWLLKRSGKDIINQIYNKVYSSHINPNSLTKAMRKLNVFPFDLVEKLNQIKVGKQELS